MIWHKKALGYLIGEKFDNFGRQAEPLIGRMKTLVACYYIGSLDSCHWTRRHRKEVVSKHTIKLIKYLHETGSQEY